MAIALAFRHAPGFSAPAWRCVLVALIVLGLGFLTRPPFWGVGHFDRLLSHGVASALIVCAALALEKRGDFAKGGLNIVKANGTNYYNTHQEIFLTFCGKYCEIKPKPCCY